MAKRYKLSDGHRNVRPLTEDEITLVEVAYNEGYKAGYKAGRDDAVKAIKSLLPTCMAKKGDLKCCLVYQHSAKRHKYV